MSAYTDLCETVTAHLVTALKTAKADGWSQPWKLGAVGVGLPVNASTGKRYLGMNSWWLMMQGYDSPFFATFKQWLALGYCVRKGEHGHKCVKWVEKKATKAQKAAGETVKGGLMPCPFTVFSYQQVAELDGFEGVRWMPPAKPTAEALANVVHHDTVVVKFFERTGAQVYFGGSRAYYSPLADHVQMPPSSDFFSTEGYYSTLAHEHGHWTGHKSRLNRDLKGRFGSSSYAMEELVAEMTAAFVMAHLGLAAMPRADHADYLANWLEVLENDSTAVWAAAKNASAAFEYLAGASAPATEVSKELVSA